MIPIILRPIDWQKTPLGQLQALPRGAKPVTQWNDQDAAFEDVARGIRKAVEYFITSREEAPWLQTVISTIQISVPYVKRIVLLLPSLFLIGLSLSIGLNLNLLAIALPPWMSSITPFLCIPVIIAEFIIACMILSEQKNVRISAKTRERRALLSAIPIGLLTLGTLLKESDSKQRIGELEKWLDKGQLTQLRMELLPAGNTGPSDTRPLENTLSGLLGLPVSSHRGQTYTDTVNTLAKGDAEVAWLGPFSYLRAHQIYGVRAILCDLTPEHQKTYQSYIIANAKANILRIEDLKGKPRKRFALVDHNSASGRVIPLYELKKAGLDPDKDIDSFYAGSHENSLEKVRNGDAPAGAVASDVYDAALKAGKFQEGDLVILMKSGDIPKGPIVVRKDIQRDDELRIEDAFLSVEEIDTAISRTMGNGGFVKITHKSYEFLIPIAKELSIDTSSLD